MKKLLLLAFAVLSLNAFALSVNVGASYQKASFTTDTGLFDAISGDNVHDYDDPVLALNVELTQGFIFGELGLGASYEQGYSINDIVKYDAVPVYGIAKINLFPIGIKPYISAKYGTVLYLNQENIDLDNGQYVSIGLGVTLIDTLQLEGSLNANKTKDSDGTELVNGSYGLTVRYNTY